MNSALLQASFLSIFIIVPIGFLVFLLIFWSKAKKSGFQSKRLDETSTILTYEQMVKQGKLTKEEYQKIQQHMLQKQGFTQAAPKPEKTIELKDQSTEEIIQYLKNQKPKTK
ncbi:MAG: hypothetical protein ACE14V_07330 [bacterium]